MAVNINNVTINATAGSPDLNYVVTYTTSRPNNSQATYNFNIQTSIVGGSTSWIGKGYVLTLYLTVGGIQQSVVLKTRDEVWKDGGLKSTKTLSITCPSTTANTNQAVTFQVVNASSELNGTAGEITTSDYYVVSPALLYTSCSAPSITISPDDFETSITLSWSGASGGVNNSIQSYLIHWRATDNNGVWSDWVFFETVQSTATSGSVVRNMPDWLARGAYVQFAIRTQGSAGESYYSDWAYSNSIRRKPYTKCTAPTSFIVSDNNFETSVTLTWSGALSGDNNIITGYEIQYGISPDNSTWSGWNYNYPIASSANSGTISIDLTENIERGYYVCFRIRAVGTAGASYYSDWHEGWNYVVRRNPYTKCLPPVTFWVNSEFDALGKTHSDVFGEQVQVGWAGADYGENNPIRGYEIQYGISDDSYNWQGWKYNVTVDTNDDYGSKEIWMSNVNRGQFVAFRIKTLSSVGSEYDSDWVGNDVNYVLQKTPYFPCINTINVIPASLEFSNGDNIVLQWEHSFAHRYYEYSIQVAIGNKNDIQNGRLNGSKVGWTSLTGFTHNSEYTTASYTMLPTNPYYSKVENSMNDETNCCIQFRVQVKDVFGLYNGTGGYLEYTYSPIITRYDTSGITIGMNNRWVNCQLFYCTPKATRILSDANDWSKWYQIPIGDKEFQVVYTSPLMETNKKLSITANIDAVYMLYYGKDGTVSTTGRLKNSTLDIDESYDYVMIAIAFEQNDGNQSITDGYLENGIAVTENYELHWVETEAFAGGKSEWLEPYDG